MLGAAQRSAYYGKNRRCRARGIIDQRHAAIAELLKNVRTAKRTANRTTAVLEQVPISRARHSNPCSGVSQNKGDR